MGAYANTHNDVVYYTMQMSDNQNTVTIRDAMKCLCLQKNVGPMHENARQNKTLKANKAGELN